MNITSAQLTSYTNKAEKILSVDDGISIFGRMYKLQKDICDPMNIDTLGVDINNPSILLMYKSSIYAKLHNEMKEFFNEVDLYTNPRNNKSNKQDLLEEAVDCISYALLLVAINNNHYNLFSLSSSVDSYVNRSFTNRFTSLQRITKYMHNHVYSAFEYANLNWHRDDKKTYSSLENEELLELVIITLNAMLLTASKQEILDTCSAKAAKVLKYMASKNPSVTEAC